jgi:hypothetical protein
MSGDDARAGSQMVRHSRSSSELSCLDNIAVTISVVKPSATTRSRSKVSQEWLLFKFKDIDYGYSRFGMSLLFREVSHPA